MQAFPQAARTAPTAQRAPLLRAWLHALVDVDLPGSAARLTGTVCSPGLYQRCLLAPPAASLCLCALMHAGLCASPKRVMTVSLSL